MPIQIDHPRLRAELARHRIPASDVAKCAGMSEGYFRAILNGASNPGELSLRRLWDALAALGHAEIAELCLSPIPSPTVAGKGVSHA